METEDKRSRRRRITRWIRIVSLPASVPVLLGTWILLDALMPPDGATLLDRLKAFGSDKPPLSTGGFLHGIAATLTVFVVDTVVMAVVRHLEKRWGKP